LNEEEEVIHFLREHEKGFKKGDSRYVPTIWFYDLANKVTCSYLNRQVLIFVPCAKLASEKGNKWNQTCDPM
jgi:hypothetical protein